MGGAARGAIAINPHFSVQSDLWIRDFFSSDSKNAAETWVDIYPGAAVHASWRPDRNTLLGVFGSIGAADYVPLQNDPDQGTVNRYAGEGVEGVVNANNWRFYGQLGVLEAVSGPLGDDDLRKVYAVLDTTYFFTPNLALSGWIGGDTYTQNYAFGRGARIGARLEYKPDNLPFSVYVSYQADGVWDTFPNGKFHGQTATEGEQIAMVGIRIPFGTATVQDLQNSTGLVDMNPNYGELPQ